MSSAADSMLESVKGDPEKAAISINSMLLTAPNLSFIKNLSQDNQVLFLQFVNQETFNKFLTQYGTEDINLLPHKKVAAWFTTIDTKNLLNKPRDMHIVEQLVMGNYVSADNILTQILASEREPHFVLYGGTKKVFQTCLYYIDDPAKITWERFKKVTNFEIVQMIAEFYSNKMQLLNLQVNMLSKDHPPVEQIE
jgi:hypothetical protein